MPRLLVSFLSIFISRVTWYFRSLALSSLLSTRNTSKLASRRARMRTSWDLTLKTVCRWEKLCKGTCALALSPTWKTTDQSPRSSVHLMDQSTPGRLSQASFAKRVRFAPSARTPWAWASSSRVAPNLRPRAPPHKPQQAQLIQWRVPWSQLLGQICSCEQLRLGS